MNLLRSLFQNVRYLAFIRKTTCLVLGKNYLSVYFYVEDAASAADEFRLDSKLFFQFLRQTGGLGSVVSLHAVCDGYFFHSILLGMVDG